VALVAGLGWALAAWPLGWSGLGIRARPGRKGYDFFIPEFIFNAKAIPV
jgi:hypothetical protein